MLLHYLHCRLSIYFHYLEDTTRFTHTVMLRKKVHAYFTMSKYHTQHILLSSQCNYMSLMEFVVSPPDCGRSVTDFWVWDAHGMQLRFPNEVDGSDTWIWIARRDSQHKLSPLIKLCILQMSVEVWSGLRFCFHPDTNSKCTISCLTEKRLLRAQPPLLGQTWNASALCMKFHKEARLCKKDNNYRFNWTETKLIL
jgi:hypothetical protein